MDGIKSALASKTVWGGIIAVAAPVAAVIFKVEVSAEDMSAAADAFAAIGSALGGLLAIYGRVTATKVIGK